MLLALLFATLPPLELHAEKSQLPNGLTVIVAPDHGACCYLHAPKVADPERAD